MSDAPLNGSSAPAGALVRSIELLGPAGRIEDVLPARQLVRERAHVTAAGFSEIRHYYRPPGRPRDQQPWLATVWRKE